MDALSLENDSSTKLGLIVPQDSSFLQAAEKTAYLCARMGIPLERKLGSPH